MRTRQSSDRAILAADRSRRVVGGALALFGLGLSLCLWSARSARADQTFTVTNADDGGSGSLRIALGLNNLSGGNNTVVFDPTFFATPRTIHLDGSLPPIGTPVTINGPGANLLTIAGDNQSRVLVINNGVQVNLNGVTIAGGNAGAEAGGGILNNGDLTITGCHITGNTAAFGGGISDGNTASLVVQQSTISNNTATGSSTGGGISSLPSVTIINSTISGNTVTGSNGGNGGGLSLASGTIESSTIANNSAAGPNSAGGLNVDAETVTLHNTIIAGNVNNGAVPDVAVRFGGVIESDGFNLIGNPGSASFSGPGTHDQKGTAVAPLNPLLGPLQDNGGGTPTYALLVGSPALDQGGGFSVVTDQRGVTRSFNIASIAGPGDQSDIGAVEMHALFVTNTDDSGTGSLHDVVTNAPDMSDILFDPTVFNVPRTISTASGEILINHSLTINGPGAGLLTLSGGNVNRIFRVAPGGLHVEISGLTFSGGNGNTDVGGAIVSDSDLTLSRCALVNNQAGNSGGAVYVGGSVGRFTDCTFSGNTSGGGSAVFLASSSGSFTNCTISGNTAPGFGAGGGIWFAGGQTLAIINSTIVNNAGVDTGGIRVEAGGGSSATLTLRNSIIANNTGPNPNLRAFSNGGTATIASLGYNLTNDNSTTFLNQPTDQTNIDPRLGPLQNNGGQTPTRMPLAGSPALDKGNSVGRPFDQRGRPRAYDIASIAPATGGDNSDIGAVEAQALFVTNADDTGPGTLRQAITDAHAQADLSDILFDNTVFNVPRTINLAGALPDINTSLTINGPGANLLTVRRDTGGVYRIFTISSTVSLSGLTIANGVTSGEGGGIGVFGGAVSVSGCAITGNQANAAGGIENNGGTLTVTASTISGNSAGAGSGLRNFEGTTTLTNCTISGNQGNGGAILNFDADPTRSSTLQVMDCTIADNTATFGGAGIHTDAQGGTGSTASTALRNTIVAGNTLPNLSSAIAGGGGTVTITSLGYNLTNDNGGGFLTGTADQTNKDPLLGPLQNNGGPTQTHALLPGSPAIDQGSSSGSSTDQRGFPRPLDNPAIANATGGDGADLGAFELGLSSCVGDCDGNGAVDVTEIIKMVNIALGTSPVSDCAAGDADASGGIDVTEIIVAVNHALNSDCPI